MQGKKITPKKQNPESKMNIKPAIEIELIYLIMEIYLYLCSSYIYMEV